MSEYETFEASDGEISIRAKAHTFQEDCWCNGPPITHEDDSYGDCTTCREWVHHTEEDYRHVEFPCPTALLATLTEGARAIMEAADDRISTLEAERDKAQELQATFDLRWKADMRAIEAWQKTHPSKLNTWPDHADLVVWLLERLDSVTLALEDMLKFGAHEGECDNGDGRDDACTLHEAAGAERMRRAQDALLGKA